MGVTASKPFGAITKEEIATAVTELGDRYEVYHGALVGNGVDGSFLEGLSDIEIQETLDDLGITNRLHRRVLIKELRDAKANTEFVAFAYEYAPSTNLSDLEAYDQITNKCFNDETDGAVYAGVHLVLDNGNHLSLASRMLRDGEIVSRRLHQPKQLSICSSLFKGNGDAEFFKIQCPARVEENVFNGIMPLTYTGYVITNESGERVGIVCRIDRCHPIDIDEPSRKAFLRQLAKEAEFQLRLRKTFLERKKTLDIKIDLPDLILPEVSIPTIASCAQQKSPATAKRRRSIGDILPFPTINQAKQEVRSSRTMPIFQTGLASGQDSAHLPSNFYDVVDWSSAPRPPIGKDDMERVAAVEALKLRDIEPGDEIAKYFNQIVKMALQSFKFPIGKITVLDHENEFSFAIHDGNQTLSNCLDQLGDVVKQNSDGTPFLCKRSRAPSIGNYTLVAGRTFVVPDMAADETFQWMAALTPLRSYIGCPIVDVSRKVIATLCLFDTKPRTKLDLSYETQIDQFCRLTIQSIEKWSLVRASKRLEEERTLIAAGRDKSAPPEGNVTIVLTDIQDSVALWESMPVEMQDSQDLHDNLVRKICADHCGYEIETEGDAFALAFHDPADAIGFALDTQKALFEADWPEGLLRQPEAREIAGTFRGLRVRMAIHHGRVDSFENEVTRRVNYKGETMSLTKRLSSLAYGGQILTTQETWEIASFFTGSTLGYPQILDLGIHVIRTGKTIQEGVVSKRIIQLVPSNLSYDFFAARKLLSDDDRVSSGLNDNIPGRRFPFIKSLKQVSASFHDAPFNNNMVTVAFVNMSAVDDRHAASVVSLIGLLLDGRKELGGYQCQREMLVFQRPVDAVLFGLRLLEELRLKEPRSDGTSLAKLIKYGCMQGSFLTMGPHRTTGRADYFGKTVNRTARLSSVIALGTVCFGVASDKGEIEDAIASIEHPSIETVLNGKKALRGIQEEIVVYRCSWARKQAHSSSEDSSSAIHVDTGKIVREGKEGVESADGARRRGSLLGDLLRRGGRRRARRLSEL
jgi:class 3 adenylate cyclase